MRLEQLIRQLREHPADDRAAEPTAAVRVTGAGNQVTAAVHEGEHVLDRKDRPDIVRRKNQDITPACGGYSRADRPGHAWTRGAEDAPHVRRVTRELRDDGDRVTVRLVGYDEDLVGDLEHGGASSSP